MKYPIIGSTDQLVHMLELYCNSVVMETTFLFNWWLFFILVMILSYNPPFKIELYIVLKFSKEIVSFSILSDGLVIQTLRNSSTNPISIFLSLKSLWYLENGGFQKSYQAL